MCKSPLTAVAIPRSTITYFFFSKQNENGIQAQEMWQLSQYLQVYTTVHENLRIRAEKKTLNSNLPFRQVHM